MACLGFHELAGNAHAVADLAYRTPRARYSELSTDWLQHLSIVQELRRRAAGTRRSVKSICYKDEPGERSGKEQWANGESTVASLGAFPGCVRLSHALCCDACRCPTGHFGAVRAIDRTASRHCRRLLRPQRRDRSGHRPAPADAGRRMHRAGRHQSRHRRGRAGRYGDDAHTRHARDARYSRGPARGCLRRPAFSATTALQSRASPARSRYRAALRPGDGSHRVLVPARLRHQLLPHLSSTEGSACRRHHRGLGDLHGPDPPVTS